MTEDNSIKDILYSIKILKERISKLEKNSHAPRDFVVCNYCKNKMKQYEGTD